MILTIGLILGAIIIILWIRRELKNAVPYKTCIRCGWELPEGHVFKDNCYGCQNMTDEYAEKLRKASL